MTIKLTVDGMMFRIARWVVTRFGQSVLLDRHERALRIVEEAMELAQAEGVPRDFVQRTLARVYSRPAGVIAQEGAGVGVTFLAWAYNAGFDPLELIQKEIERIESKPIDYFRQKQLDKARAGTARPPEES